MKIEIDLNQILGGGDEGIESLQDSVRRQVSEKLAQEVRQGIGKKIDTEIARVISETIKTNLEALTPKLFDDLMNAEFTPVDRWGDPDRGKQTTFRKELVKSIHEQMVYKETSYRDHENAFTRAVRSVVETQVKEFKESFNKITNEMFTREVMAHAQAELKKKLGIS